MGVEVMVTVGGGTVGREVQCSMRSSALMCLL